MALLDTTTPGNIDPETLKRILAGETVDGYSLGRGNYTGPTPTEADDRTGDLGQYEDVIYRGIDDPAWGTAKWNTWNTDGTYRGYGSGDSDLRAIAKAVALAGGMYAGASALSSATGASGGAGAEGMITESVGGSAGGPGSSGLLGGGEAAGGGLKTTAAMQSAMTPAGLTNATTMGTVTGGNTGFSLSNILGGMTGKDWLGAVGTAIQYADGRRQQAKAEATRATERAEDRAYNDKIREENRGWSLEDRENERAYAARQLADKQQRIGTTGGGLLGVSLKRKGT